MGITGLIPFLEKASSKIHLKDLRGSTVAVDTYCWLHKGVFSCADKLCRGEDTDMYVTYCLKYVTLLLSYDIKPILVFDGRHLPAKALTEKRRRENRDQSKKRAAELLRLGRIDEARSHMRRCIDVTHEMALRLIKECRIRNVDCIVAPYEADAQMAFLNKLDIAQYVITEDSDLVLFGCKKIIFKLDLTGAGLLVEADKLYLAMGCKPAKYTFDKFRAMCILSGCDYLDSLPGIGLAKGCKFMLMTEEDNMKRGLKKIPSYLNMRNIEVNDEYIEGFLRADATFKHMFVYNPLERRMERLYDLSTYNTEEQYCSNAGEPLDDHTAFQLALGNLNPFNLKVLDTWSPDQSQVFSNVKRAKHKSIWHSNYEPHTPTKRKIISQDIRCALQFKKVMYASPQKEEPEDQKVEESDIVALYNEQSHPPRKRRCISIENEAPKEETPTKKPYNPFPVVSPRDKPSLTNNLTESSPRKQPPVKPFKRSIFSDEVNVHIEVRSRFFANNRDLATEIKKSPVKAKEPVKSSEDVVQEISRIEKLSEQNKDKATCLYDFNSPSPNKAALGQVESVQESPISSRVLAKTESVLNSDIPPSIDSGISSIRGSETQLTCDTIEPKIEVEERENVIVLSDSEDRPNFYEKMMLKKTQVQKPRTAGLSKPKRSNTESKTSANAGQTRLSMFGFQKRPSLK